MIRKFTIVALCLLVAYSYGIAQSTPINDVIVEESKAQKVGTTKAMRAMSGFHSTPKYKKSTLKEFKKRPDNFRGRKGGQKVVRSELEHQGADPLRQSGNLRMGFDIEPLVNVPGIDIGSSPHDPSGDIGKDHYVQGINVTEIGVFDKGGNLLSRFPANNLWQSIGFTSAGDPIILWDQEFERWYITEFPNGNELLVAVSETSDPLGTYNVYNFSTPNFPDYPKYGLWNNSLTVTTNEDAANLVLYALDRSALINGDNTVTMQRMTIPGNTNTEAGFFVATPVDWTGDRKPKEGSGPYFLKLNDSSWGDVAQDQIEVYEASIDFNNPNNTSFSNTSIVTTPYDSNPCAAAGFGFSCIPQPDQIGLDGIPEVIMNQAHYRNFGSHEMMLFNFITDVTNGDNLSGIRWMEIRRTPGTEWSLYQEGTYAPDDGLHRFMGGICMDGAGNIGLAYNVSSESEFAGVRFTGRRASDPLGIMTVNEQIVVSGENVINADARFGDYSQMGVDPINDRTFWFTTEYAAGGTGASATRILAFELNKDTNDLSVAQIIDPTNSTELGIEEVLTIEIRNTGINTKEAFKVGYIFDGGTEVTEEVNFQLKADSAYIHSFEQKINFDELRDYPIKVFVFTDVDENRNNDTINTSLTKYPFVDLEVTSVTPKAEKVCANDATFDVVLKNNGVTTVDSFVLKIMRNGSPVQEIRGNEALEFKQSTILDIPFAGLENGITTIDVTVEPLELLDEIIDNNIGQSMITNDSTLELITINFLTDLYPEESSWTLSTTNGTTIGTNGAMNDSTTLYTTQYCLHPDSCFVFTVTDNFGDGLAAEGVEGNYEILSESGQLLASILNPSFGYEEVNEFCAKYVCNLMVDVAISAETSDGMNDAAIIITPRNGVGPFMYSIDNGATFQASNAFTNLSSGSFFVVVQGGEDCLQELVVEIPTCTLEVMIETVNASSQSSTDGAITISVGNGNSPYQYSIDGGNTFQNNPEFDELPAGKYQIVVTDDFSCEYAEEIIVDFSSSTKDVVYGYNVLVAPNPTNGLFNIEIKGYKSSEYKLKTLVYNMQGKKVRQGSLYRYNDVYKGEVSITTLPSGTYLVKISDIKFNKLYKIVKI